MNHPYDDIMLLDCFRRGERAAERELFERFFGPLCLFSERITGDLPQSEDTVAEAFEKLIDRRQDFDALYKVKSFLYNTVRNASINYVVARKRHQIIHANIRLESGSATQQAQNESPADALEFEIMRAELISRIYNEMDRLPGKCGKIFKMIFVDQLPTDEIASRLSINPQTVRSQKARAIQLIKTSLQNKNSIPALMLFLDVFRSHLL